MIIAKVCKSCRYDAKEVAKNMAANMHNRTKRGYVVRETPCYFFVESVETARRI